MMPLHQHSIETDTGMAPLELGLDTFGDVTVDSAGQRQSDAQVIRNVIAQGVLADQVGIDFIGIGEHHRDDFAISAPDMVLAAIAGQTERIHLGTAVTVLSSDDPIRVFERFSTLDAASNGRAEVILGRGSFTESFPLFGFDLADYETLFNEKLDLFVQLLKEKPITWSGSYRAPLVNQDVFPKTESGRLTSWIGVGGSPESVVRSVRTGIPMMLAIIGGDPGRFLPYVELYGRASDQLGLPRMPLGAHSPGHVAATDELAREQLWPHFKANRDRIGGERGWPPVTETEFVNEIEHGSLYAGSPETVARRIAKTAQTLGLDRFDLKYANGPMPHEQLMSSIELYGTQVIPLVREMLA
jgi:probable LLM family oxidoreductase